jgi:predicted alpha/beta-hydrolase family hydrolase
VADPPREHRFGAHVGLLQLPADATAFLSLAHGAGAGMRHPFMSDVAAALARRRVATLRFEFPYAAAGARRPDPRPVLIETVVAAADEARRLAGGLPLLAGGKSMGGRMSSHAAAAGRLPSVRGLVFFGFPLHGAGKPATERADHLADHTPLLEDHQGRHGADVQAGDQAVVAVDAGLRVGEGVKLRGHGVRWIRNLAQVNGVPHHLQDRSAVGNSIGGSHLHSHS